MQSTSLDIGRELLDQYNGFRDQISLFEAAPRAIREHPPHAADIILAATLVAVSKYYPVKPLIDAMTEALDESHY